ncbi:hypothetical protein CDAR_561401 [Caerostris darwini]|uniref:Uncharacterized protein n=1 Tax=Caerostris darwini TaxID=1538125 RepID=A0AAV4TZ10_9ARAC|nr:hypothetical protein CDAR_561401 [Caerostris darwini]
MWVIVTKTSFGESRTKAGEGVPVASDPERSRPDIDPPSQGRTSIWTHPVNKTRCFFLESNRAVGGRRNGKGGFSFDGECCSRKDRASFHSWTCCSQKPAVPLINEILIL